MADRSEADPGDRDDGPWPSEPVALPKPPKRGPKPRRRIASKSARAPVGKVKKPKPKVVSAEDWIELCDRMHSLTVRLLGGGRCKLCGRTSGQNCQCAHLISRGKFLYRWEQWNCWCLCPNCHTKYTHNHNAWEILMVDTFGLEGWMQRRRLAEAHHGRPLYRDVAALLVYELEAAHRAVPYDALTEALHERAREVLAKAGRMIG